VAHQSDDHFLARWSRRKHAVRRGETPPEPARSEAPAETAPPPAAAPAAPPTELPAIESLQGLESDYQDFLRPEVDQGTKSAALRKLFGDPHFNKMDGLDVYIDDYTKEDPIPATMLRVLNQARSLGLFDDEEKEKSEKQTGSPGTADAAAPPQVAKLDHATPATLEPSELGFDAETPLPDPAKPDPA
jgi:hypothetical protein